MTLINDPDIQRNRALWNFGQRYGSYHVARRRLLYRLAAQKITDKLQIDIACAGYAAGFAASANWAERLWLKLAEFWRAT